MKKQIIIVDGGDPFKNYQEYIKFLKAYKVDIDKMKRKKWKKDLPEKLGRGYDVKQLVMPNTYNVKYLEWIIWFEKYIPLMQKEILLMGHSLGGIFLTKYLSENKMKKNIKALFLIAPPFDDKDAYYSLADFKLKKDLSLIEKQCEKIIFYHSKDDFVVSFSELEKYRKKLPNATCRIFSNRTHFIGSTFPEIVRDIKAVTKK